MIIHIAKRTTQINMILYWIEYTRQHGWFRCQHYVLLNCQQRFRFRFRAQY